MMLTTRTFITAVLAFGLAALIVACADKGGIEEAALEVSAGGGAASCTPLPPLTTTYVGGNAQNGVMFDLVAGGAGIRIEGFDAHDPDVAGTPADWEIYYKMGPYSGFETTPGAWSLLGSVTGVPSQGPGLPTPLPITVNVTLPPGQTAAFYLTRTDGGTQSYTNGTLEGALFATDGDVDFLEGTGVLYAFATTFAPRVYNGTIHHSLCP